MKPHANLVVWQREVYLLKVWKLHEHKLLKQFDLILSKNRKEEDKLLKDKMK